jgi:phenylacetic acid degradation operon negative regulatory protein
MTIIDELLILLDDLGETQLESVPAYFDKTTNQVLFSSTGRLVSRGWVQKKANRHQTLYSITSHGVAELNRTLDSIKKEEVPVWNHRWHLVIFDIPETKRKLRDVFRESLRELGFGMLKSSIWISSRDMREDIKRLAKRHNLGEQIIQLESSETDPYQSSVLVRNSWDWKHIEKLYLDFIKKAEKELPQLDPAKPATRFKAKKLVFSYAEVVKCDPVLPTDISPNTTVARRAHDLYVKIRPFCLET